MNNLLTEQLLMELAVLKHLVLDGKTICIYKAGIHDYQDINSLVSDIKNDKSLVLWKLVKDKYARLNESRKKTVYILQDDDRLTFYEVSDDPQYGRGVRFRYHTYNDYNSFLRNFTEDANRNNFRKVPYVGFEDVKKIEILIRGNVHTSLIYTESVKFYDSEDTTNRLNIILGSGLYGEYITRSLSIKNIDEFNMGSKGMINILNVIKKLDFTNDDWYMPYEQLRQL